MSSSLHMRPDLTQQAMRDFKAVFHRFDVNKDGTIDRTEFADVIHLLGDERPSDAELRRVMRAACDVPDDQPAPTALNFEHFLNFFAIFKQHRPVPDQDVFTVLDRDRNGSVSARELLRTFNSWGMMISQDEADAMADVASTRLGVTEFDEPEFYRLTATLRERRLPGSAANSSHDFLPRKP